MGDTTQQLVNRIKKNAKSIKIGKGEEQGGGEKESKTSQKKVIVK